MDGPGKMSHIGKEIKMKRIPYLVIAIHSMLVIFVAVFVAIYGGESVMLWAPFMVLDFPVSRLMPFFEKWSLVHLGAEITYTIVFGLFFGILGGMQYFLVVHAITAWFAKKTKKGVVVPVVPPENSIR